MTPRRKSASGAIGADRAAAVTSVVPAPAEAVIVVMHEVAPSAYMRGGTNRAPAPALPSAEETVRGFRWGPWKRAI